MTEGLDRRRFLGRGVRVGVGLASALLVPSVGSCSRDPDPVCGLGCAGDADTLAGQLGAPLRYERIFHTTEMFPDAQETAAWTARRIPVSSYKTLDPTGAPVPFASVASGAANAQLDALAGSLNAGLTDDIVLIYFHEPEAEAGADREAFADAFRHVRSRIEGGLDQAARARIRWAMCLTHAYYRDGSAELFYPGDDFIDLLAVDGYNWCPGSGHGANQITFRDLFAPAEAFARRQGKSWLITEVGTWDDPAPGWSKADWIDQAVGAVEQWPSLEAVMWFEHSDGFLCEWSIGQDDDALDAFRRLGERMCTRS